MRNIVLKKLPYFKWQQVSVWVTLLISGSISYYIATATMGNVTLQQLSVVSLNYSGILYNPFQFFSESEKQTEEQLSQIFEKLFYDLKKGAKKETFKWDIGKIDQTLHKQRYSPLYNPEVGLKNDVLISEGQFIKIWHETFKKIPEAPQFKPNQIENMAQFDLLCYRTLFTYCKGDSTLYKSIMQRFFNKSFLVQQKKITKTIQALKKEKVDVALIQQANEKLLSAVTADGQYVSIMSKYATSVIILKKKRFQKFHNTQLIMKSLGPQFQQLLNFNNDTMIAFVDNIIFVSAHLSSKTEKNAQQIRQMVHALSRLQAIYPMLYIVIGCDANGFIVERPNNYNVFPNDPKTFTTSKMRTWMQPQTIKAKQMIKSCKDFVLTTAPITRQRIVTILGQNSDNISLLPTQNHPYDHLVVNVHISIRKY